MKQKFKITIGSLTIGRLAKKLINNTLRKNRLTYGDLTIRFEKEFARAHGGKFGIFTVSGTAALQVALHALKSSHGWKDGDEVIVPSVTFVATSNIVLRNNLKPVFVDVDPVAYTIDSSKIEEKITSRTRCIIPVHLFGLPADMEPIVRLARRRKLKVLVDSCETMLVKYRGEPLGAWGDIICFSTYAAHLLVTGVGGFMLTDNPEYATKMRSLINHGRDTIYYNIDQDDSLKSAKALFRMADRRFSFIDVGYSYRLTELEAAIGIEDLRRLPRTIAARQKNARYLLNALQPFSAHLQLPSLPRGFEHAFMMFPIVIKKNAPFSRGRLIEHLESHGVETRYAMPLLNQPIYRRLFGSLETQYPVARWLNANGFYIGCHQLLKLSDLEEVKRVFMIFFDSLAHA